MDCPFFSKWLILFFESGTNKSPWLSWIYLIVSRTSELFIGSQLFLWMNCSAPNGVCERCLELGWKAITKYLSYRGSSKKTWTRKPIPMMSNHLAHLVPLQELGHAWLSLWPDIQSAGQWVPETSSHESWSHLTRGRQHVSFRFEITSLCQSIKIMYITKAKLSRTYIHACVHAYMHSCMHAYIPCMHACIDACIHTCMHACIHTYMHTYTHIHTYLLLLISMLWHRQAIFESKGDKLSSSAESRIRTQRVSETSSRLKACWQTDWAIEDQAKNLNSTARPYDQQAFSPPDPLPFGIRTWLWRYTYLLLLISMLWHRQAIFESKGDKLSSSAESRIRTQRVSETQSPADWMPADKPTELSRIKLKTWTRQPVLMISKHSAHLTHCHLAFAPGSGDIHICCC